MTDSEYIKKLNSGLSSYLDEQIKKAASKESRLLIRRLKQITQHGKRLRPSLLINIYSAYGGKKGIVSIGIALELLHESLLIHDDLIDEDLKRHGQLNIAGLYLKDTKDKKLAYDQALLAGDLVHNFSLNLIVELPAISRLFNDAFISAIYGQQLDVYNVHNNLAGITLKEILNIYELKTASYSCLLPIKIAASLVNIETKELDKLTGFAKYLGIYVQLQNDHQDYFSTHQLKDYALGKITYPYLSAIKLSTGSDLKYLTTNFGKAKIDNLKITNILKRVNAREPSEDLLNKYLSLILRSLDKLNISEEDKLNLIALVDRIGV